MTSVNQQCTYAFSQLASRDEVVFKSIIGLLSGRTSVQWQHVMEGAPDLLVLGFNDKECVSPVTTSKVILRISPKVTWEESMTVHWPLRATEVFTRLEQVAQQLRQPRSEDHRTFKLLGWPAYSLLASDAAYLRMTTLLGTRAMTLAELSERAQVDLAHCARFVERLQEHALLQIEEPSEEVLVAATPPATTGFFARLRAHLGMAPAKAE